MYSYDECGCCLVCAKSELRSCGGGQNKNEGQCAKGLSCLKTCCKYFKLFIKITHPPSREHFSLKIDVRDQTIWNCILEL